MVGAGPAGLGAAAEIARRGMEPLVLEREAIGVSWRKRYDHLRLNTVRWMSGLPSMRIPRGAGRWPARDDYVAYLERYAERFVPRICLGVEVTGVEREGDGWCLRTSAGEVRCEFVVIATGLDGRPFIPSWPGRDGFAGELIHSSRYRDPHAFAGKRVLVVGIGNSGIEIAVACLRNGAARVQVSKRSAINIFKREIAGIPTTPFLWAFERVPTAITDTLGFGIQRLLWGDLERFGLERAPRGLATQLRTVGMAPVADSGFVAAVKSREIELLPAVEAFDGRYVALAGGRRIEADVVIAATGFRRGLEPLVGHLGVLGENGWPLVADGSSDPSVPGLFFNGFYLPLSGAMSGLRRSSRAIGRSIARQRGQAEPATGPARVRAGALSRRAAFEPDRRTTPTARR